MTKKQSTIGDRAWDSKFEYEVLWEIGRKLSDSIDALKSPSSSSCLDLWLTGMGPRVELPIKELKMHTEAFHRCEKNILALLTLLRKRFPATDTPFPSEFDMDFINRQISESHMDFIRRQIKEFEDLVAFHQVAKSGEVSKEGGRKGGIVRGKQQTTNREKEWEKWQTEADKIWKKHPTWGKPAIAKMVHEKYPGSTARTIRLRIKKPVS